MTQVNPTYLNTRSIRLNTINPMHTRSRTEALST